MSHTHSCLLYHFVFSTRHREPWLEPEVQAKMFPYMAGILKGLGAHPKIINGMPDHVHIFVGLKTTHCVADVLRDVKAGSSKYFHETYKRSAFAWQEGYGAFTVSPFQQDTVYSYITNQAEHHRVTTFKEEYIHMLDVAGIEYDKRFVFD